MRRRPALVALVLALPLVAWTTSAPRLADWGGVRIGEALATALKGGKPEKEILVPIVIATSKNIDQILPTIKQTVFANELP